MDNNNLFDKDNQNGEQGQFQQQPYQPQQPYQQPYQQQPYQPQQPYQQSYQPQQSYQQPYQQQPYQSGDSDMEEPVTFADWMVSMLLMYIPCVNIIMMFVWAFGSNTKKSKSNYFKAALAWTAIAIVLAIVLSVIFGISLAALPDYYY